MGIVRRLSEKVANQIAAGEVVQRPASVVKELLENAIDAGSSMVIVNIEDGGKELIQVIDDGVGMSFEDAVMAFERHATSKIAATEDLETLSTFGFRGEALPSIASVSETEMKTSRDQDDLGCVVRVNGGVLEQHTKELTTKGTQISVRKLFYNVPARRKFLKSASSETKHIIQEFKKIALCNPQVSLFLYCNSKSIYNLPIAPLRHRVNHIMGKNINTQLMEMSVETSLIEIKGYIGTPEIAIQTPDQFMFVNGRFFRNNYFNKAIVRAFENILPNTKHAPRYFLYFTVDPAEIDVNVHPQKTEVKFENETQIWQILHSSVKAVLGKNGIAPTIDFDLDNRLEIPAAHTSDGIVVPETATNSTFNPFDENFSFSKAIEQDDSESTFYTAFKDSVTEDYHQQIIPSGELYSEDRIVESGFEMAKQPQHKVFGWEDFQDNLSEFETAEKEQLTVPAPQQTTLRESETFLTEAPAYDLTTLGECTFFTNRYILAPLETKLLIINTKGALRRIYYNQFSGSIGFEFQNKNLNKLMFPITIPLSVEHRAVIDQCKEDLLKVGFDICDSEIEGAIEIQGIPAEYEKANVYEIFEEILESLSSDDRLGYTAKKREQLITKLTESAVQQKLERKTREECRAIVERLFACEEYRLSPKGEPIFIEIAKSDIEKWMIR